MAFKKLNEVFDARLPLPGDGDKIYFIPEPDAELGAWCTAMYVAGVRINMGEEIPEGDGIPPLQLDDDDEMSLYRRILGTELIDQLAADGKGYATIRMFGQTGFIWIGAGTETAEAFWNSGGDPKASAPRDQRRQAAKKAQATGTTRSTGAASTTNRAGSTSGTTHRKAQPRKPRARP